VEQAVREALASSAISKPHILNRLGRLLDATRPLTLQPPPALTHAQEPRANTARYDHQREARHVR